MESVSERCDRELLLEFCDIIDQLLKENRWIPVSERLPEKEDYYNIVRFAIVRVAGIAYWNGKSWRKTPHHRYIEKITHWKPIILPKEE